MAPAPMPMMAAISWIAGIIADNPAPAGMIATKAAATAVPVAATPVAAVPTATAMITAAMITAAMITTTMFLCLRRNRHCGHAG